MDGTFNQMWNSKPVSNNIFSLLNKSNPKHRLEEYLKNNSINYNERNKSGRNVLGEAIVKCEIETIEFLLQNGADIESKSKGGLTPLAIATLAKKPNVVLFLLEYGCDCNNTNNENYTALHLACIKGFTMIINILLQHGAKPMTKSIFGKSTIDDCKYLNNRELVIWYHKRTELTKDVLYYCRAFPPLKLNLPIELYTKIVTMAVSYGYELERECQYLVSIFSTLDNPKILNIDEIFKDCPKN